VSGHDDHFPAVPGVDHPVTPEMLDKGVVLKRSFDLTERMMEAWMWRLVEAVTDPDFRSRSHRLAS